MRTIFRKTLLCYFFVEGSVKTMEETRRKNKNKKNEKNDENRTETTPNLLLKKYDYFVQRLLNSLLDRFWRFWALNDRWRMAQCPSKKKLRFSKCFIAKNAIFIELFLSPTPGKFRYFLAFLKSFENQPLLCRYLLICLYRLLILQHFVDDGQYQAFLLF